MKPTYGRVSRYGLVAFASSLDQVGPIGKSVEDTARILEVISGHDPRDSTSAPVLCGKWVEPMSAKPVDWSKVTVGVPKEYFTESLAPEVDQSIRRSLNWLETKGAHVKEISLPHTQYAVACYYMVAVSEASSNLARYDGVRFGSRPAEADQASSMAQFYERVRSQFGAEVKRRIILGTFALSSGYYDAYYRKACQVRRLIKEDFDQVFGEIDLIVSAVAPTPAFRRGEKTADPLSMYTQDILTIPASLAGLPAISVPCGEDSEGLSIGVQMIGQQFGEERLLAFANDFEKGFQDAS